MASYYANDECFYEVSIGGKRALFSDVRIKRASIPKELYVYEVRHADEDWDEPCQIKRGIMVNFYGTLISNEPLLKEGEDSIYFDMKKDRGFWKYLNESPKQGVYSLIPQ